MSLDAELRAMLVCPVCRGDLEDVERGLLCPACAVVYPVIDDVPVMLREQALPATGDERGETSPS